MDKEDDADDLDEYSQYREYLSDKSHVKEYAEDVERKQGNDGGLDRFCYDLLEIVYRILQGVSSVECSKSEAEHECKNQGCHNTHEGRDGNAEVRTGFYC